MIQKLSILIITAFTSNLLFSQWTQVEGPRSIDVTDMYMDSDGSILCASYENGIFKKSAGQRHWTKMSARRTIKQLASNNTYMFAANASSSFFGTDFIVRSDDNGATWQKINFPESGVRVLELLGFEDLLFVVGSDGLYTSSDGGLIFSKQSELSIVDFKVHDNKVYASGANGIYQWNGESWELLIDLGAISRFDVASNEIFAANSSELYKLALNAGVWESQLFSSLSQVDEIHHKDGDWCYIANGEIFMNEGDTLVSTGRYFGEYLNASAIYNDSLMVGTSAGIFYGDVKSDVFIYDYDSLPNSDVNDILEFGNEMHVATRHGVFKLNPEGTWISQSIGLKRFREPSRGTEGILVYALEEYQDNLYAGTKEGTFKLDKTTGNWEVINNSIDEVKEIYSHGGFLFQCADFDGVYRYDGTSSIKTSIGLGSTPPVREMLEIDSGLLVSSIGLYFSKNNGEQWEPYEGAEDLYRDIEIANDSSLLLSSPGGVNHFFNGDSKRVLNIDESRIISLDSVWLAGSRDGIMYLSDNLTDWYGFNLGLEELSAEVLDFYIRDENVYASIAGHGFFIRPIDQFVIETSPDLLVSYQNLEEVILEWEASEKAYTLSRSVGAVGDFETLGEMTDNAFIDTDARADEVFRYTLSIVGSDEGRQGDTLVFRLPSQIEMSEVENVTDSSFIASWTGDSTYSSYVYSIYEGVDFVEPIEAYHEIMVEDTSVTVTNLRESTSYSIEIEGITELGRSGIGQYTAYVTTGSKVVPLSVTDKFEITVFPNPTSSKLAVRSNERYSQIEILDLDGKTVLKEKFSIPKQETQLSINLHPSTYILRIHLEHGGFEHSILVVK